MQINLAKEVLQSNGYISRECMYSVGTLPCMNGQGCRLNTFYLFSFKKYRIM